MILSPQFWEWFYIWLVQVVKILYDESAMVALRGGNCAGSSHVCGGARAADAPGAGGAAPPLPMQHLLQPVNNVSVHLYNNSASPLKHDQPSTRYSNPNCMPSHHYRLLAQARAECYHAGGAGGAGYMQGGAPQPPSQPSMRGPAQQPPPQQQQDMSKTSMPAHNFGPSQNQSQQARPQYNYTFRATQHGTRPASHPRQQQPYIQGGSATGNPPVMYPTLVYPQMTMPSAAYPQQRGGQGYYQYLPQLHYSYGTPPNHTQSYYYPAATSQQIQTPNLGGNGQGRSSAAAMVGPQAPAAQAAPAAPLPHQQPPAAHMHPNMQNMRPAQTKRTSHRLKIIDPVTRQDILSDISNDSQYVSRESSERQTPQPEPTPTGISIAEEFTRMVNEAANQPSESTIKTNYTTTKNIETVTPIITPITQPQTNAISSINNNIVKSDILAVNENKSIVAEVAVEPCETPVVSAISDSPVIVPKLPTNVKQTQKTSETLLQPLVLDTNKNIATNKVVPKVNKSKPEEVEKIEKLEAPPPQPQRLPRERVRSEGKEHKEQKEAEAKEAVAPAKLNGPAPAEFTPNSVEAVVNNIAEVAKSQTSQIPSVKHTEFIKQQAATKQTSVSVESDIAPPTDTKSETVKPLPVTSAPTATELLSASIEKVAKDLPSAPKPELERQKSKEASSAFEAQVKLTQSIASCIRSSNQPESKMKDINLNNKTTDPDTANGNNTTPTINKTDSNKEDINRNEKANKNSKNMSKKGAKSANIDAIVKEPEANGNAKDEPVKASSPEEMVTPEKAPSEEKTEEPEAEVAPAPEEPAAAPAPAAPAAPAAPPAPAVFVPKYKYTDDQWSPLNKSGKRCYDLGLLKQIRDDPLSKNKPDIPIMEKVVRMETMPFTPISRPINDALFPSFVKNTGGNVSRGPPGGGRDIKKDGRNMAPSGKGSVKLTPNQGGNGGHKPVIHVSLSLREDVKLNETENAWKPSRFKKDTISEEEYKTQDLEKKFRGILNKLTPQKFDTLMDRVKGLEINTQQRLVRVIDLVFEKAIEEPNFSEAYAAMCNKLYKLKVPADNASSPDQCVNFRALIINKCQQQFVTGKVDENAIKLEKELSECTDPAKRKELAVLLNEENRRMRMRSVGNVRFIGELYKLKMLTSKIMVFCMNHLIDKLEEEKLECLCKLLTTIGEQVEGEVREQLDAVFKKMQDIVERKSNKISSRVRFMLQDVIELRRRRWLIKSVVDSQPKMMDQIQKEAEQHQRQIELMNSAPMSGGFRRDDGGRGKRGGDNRRGQGGNNFDANNWKTTASRPTNYSVDTTKLKAGSISNNKNLSTIKLAPTNTGWNCGSGSKSTTAQASSNSHIGLPTTTTNNKYGLLAESSTDPTSLHGLKDISSPKGASIERSTFSSRNDFSSGGNSRSGSMGIPRSNSGTRTAPAPAPPAPAPAAPAPPPPTPQEPLPDNKKNSVKSMVGLALINSDSEEMVHDVKQLFPAQYHAGVVGEILNIALEKSAKDIAAITKSLLHLVSTGTISADNFLAGFKEIIEFAPDLYIDIPMLYEYLGMFFVPQIEKKHITLAQVLRLSGPIVSVDHGHLLLKAILRQLKDSMGPTFVKTKWVESEQQLKDWMKEDQAEKFLEENKLEFLAGAEAADEARALSPADAQAKLLQLMNNDENCECIRGWVKDNVGNSSNSDWFMRSLIQAICEHALFGPEGRAEPHFNQDRMNKYSGLINDFGDSRPARESNCLIGIQQLIHRLEHPQGLTLEIFQCLHDQYLITVEGFTAWEMSETEPEGKGVMLKALTSFFTNIKEADNEDSCSED
ncbi:eukaryotic translation initiation factor 4 gamma 1 isoform X4 [Plutella xylostella]|uniref:eukaryotic translation initiation factor 4 gamma 1 isoform X4 n=1 Tax=Plutella xylostella TaxID=51655 RepID=UPI002032FF9C|nr:eukaryotic translation initiation factor 4 gamma 1 isoform X4 [Plutella xylostella]